MDLINFRVGQKTISLKILDILLTERFEDNLTSLPNDNKSFIGVKDYMETPTPIFDLGIILNKQSTQDTNLSLVNGNKNNTNGFSHLKIALTKISLLTTTLTFSNLTLQNGTAALKPKMKILKQL